MPEHEKELTLYNSCIDTSKLYQNSASYHHNLCFSHVTDFKLNNYILINII